MQIESAKDLAAYELANEFAMEIFRDHKEISSGRKIRVEESDSALVAISLFESSGGVGKDALRSAFCVQVSGL
jgi:hypothetical protein